MATAITSVSSRRSSKRTLTWIRPVSGYWIRPLTARPNTDQDQKTLLQKLVNAMIKRLDLELIATSRQSARVTYIPKSPTGL